jgi:uncharacterized membrane protein YgdD (TMEM256/DUF423 family)
MFMRTMKTAAGILGLTGVALGAFGAHALKGRLADHGMTDTWATAVQYHLVHAAALLALTAICSSGSKERCSRKLSVTAGSWIIGVILFSGSLYVMASGGPRWLGPVTPLGGMFLLVGWACLAIPEGDARASKEAK